MRKLLIISILFLFAAKSQAQIWQKVGSKLVLIQGSDTLTIDSTAKYTTALLQNIKGTVAASTNAGDSSLVWDAISRSIKKRLITGGGGGSNWGVTGNDIYNLNSGIVITNDLRSNTDIHVGDNNNSYGPYHTLAIGGSSKGAVLDFVHNGVRVGEFYTTTSNFNFFTGVGKDLNFYTDNNFNAPAFYLLTNGDAKIGRGNLYVASLATSLTAPTTTGTTKMVVVDANGLLSNAAIPSGGGTTYTGTAPINVTGSVISVSDASASNSGVVTTTTQSFAGNKTLTGELNLNAALKFNNVAGFANQIPMTNAVGIPTWTSPRNSIFRVIPLTSAAAGIGLSPGTFFTLADGILGNDFFINISALNLEGDVIKVFSEEATHNVTFSGQTLYQLNGTTPITSIAAGQFIEITFLNGKARKTN